MSKIKLIFSTIFFLLLYIEFNSYMGYSVFSKVATTPKIANHLFWALFFFVALSYFFYVLLNTYFPKYLSSSIVHMGIYYLALFVYFLLFFFLKTLFLNINNFFHFFPTLKGQSIIFTVLFFFVILSLLAIGIFNAHNSYVKNYDIKIAKKIKEERLKIVLLSDLHLGAPIGNSRIETMVSEINSLNPDMVFLAGDLIDGSIEPFKEKNMAFPLSKIKSKYGTFFTLGNHDLFDNKAEDLCSLLKDAGIIVLRDEYKLVNNSFYVVGRDDTSIDKVKKRKALKEILSDIDCTKAILVIDHNPSSIDESIASKIDLQVSGHTHKGQLAPFNLITKGAFKIHYGHMKKNNCHIIVSSGYGTWGPPVRIGSRSEIVTILIKK